MAFTQVSDLDSIIQVIVGKTIFTQRHEVVMPQLVTRVEYPQKKGSPMDLPKLGKLTAYALTEAVPMGTPQTVSDTDIPVNPTEVGLRVVLTDRALARAYPGFDADVAEEMSRAFGYKLDYDGLAMFSGFATGLSGANASLAVGHLGAGRARVLGNATEPAKGDIFCVLHPYHMWDIQSAISNPAATYPSIPGISEEVLRNAYKGPLFGMKVFEDGNIAVDGNDDAYSAIFAKGAIVLVETEQPHVERERDIDLRGWDIVLWGEYAYAERTDTMGYYLLADATAPTA